MQGLRTDIAVVHDAAFERLDARSPGTGNSAPGSYPGGAAGSFCGRAVLPAAIMIGEKAAAMMLVEG